MLVIISDLHFTDGTTSNWKKKEDLFNINPRAFRLFLSRISDIVELRNIREVHFVYNGDIFDPLRTHAWFDIDTTEHPWSIPPKSEKVAGHTEKILENIIDNPCNKTSLQWLSGTHEEFTEVWKQSDSDVTVRRTYIPGNHDRIINLYPDCRKLVYERLLNVSGEDGRFENLYFDQSYQTIVMHGHEADSFNCEYDKDDNPMYAETPIGDPMTTMLFANIGKKSQGLQIPAAAKKRFKDIDNVRPSLAAIRFVQDIAKDFGIGKKVQNMVKEIVREFKDMPFYSDWEKRHDHWNIGYDEADKLQTALRAIEFLGTSVPAGVLEKLAGFLETDVYRKYAYTQLRSPIGVQMRYCILGHTHEPFHAAISFDKERGIEKHYLNTGTFRTTFGQTYDKEDFFRFQRLSYVIIYGPKEYTNDQDIPMYESWAGLRMNN